MQNRELISYFSLASFVIVLAAKKYREYIKELKILECYQNDFLNIISSTNYFFLFNLSSGALGQEDPEDQVENLKTWRLNRIIILLRSRKLVETGLAGNLPTKAFSAIPRDRREHGNQSQSMKLFRDFSLLYCTLEILNVAEIQLIPEKAEQQNAMASSAQYTSFGNLHSAS